MRVHVLLNLLNELRKRDKMRGLSFQNGIHIKRSQRYFSKSTFLTKSISIKLISLISYTAPNWPIQKGKWWGVCTT